MFRSTSLAALLLSALPALAQPNAGAYLAGRAAQIADDFEASSRYLSQALQDNAVDPSIREALVGARISLMDFEGAIEVARDLTDSGAESQIAALALHAEQAKTGNWSDILNDLDAGLTVGPLFDGVLRAFALMGEGRIDDAMSAFDTIIDTPGTRAFGVYYKALALAQLNRFEDAAAIFDDEGDLRLTRRAVRAKAQILSNAGRGEEALAAIVTETDGDLDASLQATRDLLEAGEPLVFDIAPDPQSGIAEIAFDIANTVLGETAPSYTLLYTRIAEYLRPGHAEAGLLSALLLENMQQYDLAIDTYDRVPVDDPIYVTAQLGAAQTLREAGREEAAIAAMQSLAADYPDQAIVHITLGDALRESGAYDLSEAAYDDAIALFDEESESQWIVYFARAIARERQDDWDGAEADFRTALELRPDHPSVLNYLGYSMIERRDRLEEALGMIEKAVEGAPDSGAIVDSLGWALYRLGRYDDAVEPMERAVELMPVDPVVNDHLGDVLWSVGRELEARFQWRRALSFIENDQNQDVDPDLIRRKLEIGLDAALEEDGTPRGQVADGG